MENNFKQFAAIASNWVPNNPVKAFLPFFYYYINNEVSNSIKTESISKGLERVFGIHFPYHAIVATLSYLKSTNEAEQDERSYWVFKLKAENKRNTSLKFNDGRSALLIEAFKNYYPDDQIVQENAEGILNSFFSRYDYEVMSIDLNANDESKFKEYDYFVAQFIENLEKTNKDLFDFVVQIAKGSIVKSIVLSDHYNIKFFKNVKYYLDTKIVFLALGYYGNYFEKEYLDFISTLNGVGAKVCITDYVLNEIISILRSCEKYVDSQDYKYELSFDILRSFRKQGITSYEVSEMIIRINSLIEQCGIEIEYTPSVFLSSESFCNPYNKIYEAIQSVYGFYDYDEFGNEYSAALETDIRSILYAYDIRNNNTISSIRAAKIFFVTTNRAIVKMVNEYHEKTYGKTISPITTDEFIGVLLLGCTENKSMPKIKLLAFCNECFNLADDVRKKYIEKVNDLENKKEITEEEVFLLKNSGIIDDALIYNYRKNNYLIDNKCIYDVLADIKESMVNDLNSKHQREIKQLNETNQKNIEVIEKEHEQKIIEANNKNAKMKKALVEAKIKPYKIIFVIYYIFVSLVISASIFCSIYEGIEIFVNQANQIKWFYFIGSILLSIYCAFEIVYSAMCKKGPLYILLEKIYKNKLKKIESNID